MIAVDKTAAVSCYADAAAFLVMIILALLAERLHRKNNTSLKLFFQLRVSLTAICLLSFACHAMIKQPALWCHSLAIAAMTLWKWFTFLIVLLWAEYTETKTYGSKKRRSLINVVYNLPFGVFTLLLIVNLFTGILFTCTEENRFDFTPLYYVCIAVEAGCFLLSVVRIRYYNRKGAKVSFIRVIPMLVPVVSGLSVQYFFPCEADALGYSIGAVMLFFAMADEVRFLDEESGLYNRNFLAYLFDLSMTGTSNARSALILETNGSLPACFDILRDTLHQNGDVIRVEEKKFLMFSGEKSRSAIQYLSSRVDEAAEKHNKEHPEEKVQITTRYRIQTSTENQFDFLRAILDEKEAGDEIRGVVSMISELDRLDKELKLAADIQINTLPMNFPPFPDRNEFDLYASMTPAKEVGGDFYDFFLVDDDHLALVIADVSGKGIPAALFMMVSKTLIKNQMMTGCDPATALERVNLQLCERNSSMMFVTAWLAVVEISTGKGMACNAGHENPGIRYADRDFELLKYKHNMVLGVNKKAAYQVREFELHPGDCVFVYTDGVPEATDAEGKMFGGDRLVNTLNRNADAEPEELIRQVHGAVDLFADDTPQFDDITMLCLKYYGSQGRKEKK